MNRTSMSPVVVFSEIDEVEWSRDRDAFVVETRAGARLVLSPNSDETVAHGVHIDEIEVPKGVRQQGSATLAACELCQLADRYEFRLEAGPVGWSEHPWRDKFVAWVLRLGFVSDPRFAGVPIDDPKAFYVQRLPRTGRFSDAGPGAKSTPRLSGQS